jgi:hypothetical protein
VANPLPADNPLRAYLQVQRKYDADLDRILESTARSIQARIKRLPIGVGGQVRAAQLRLTLAEIKTIQSAMWLDGVRGNIVAGRKAAYEAAIRGAETMAAVAYASLPERVAQSLIEGLRASAMSGIASDAARIPRELSTRIYRNRDLTSGNVERTIRQGLISNLSARELARDVFKYISPTVPGGASYAAHRLARTEINNAFHERQIQGANRPGVESVIWNLSGSHPKPDECNQFAAKRYKPNNVPAKPHPNCFCYLTYDTMSPAKFIKALENGDFDEEIDRRTKENVRRLVNA